MSTERGEDQAAVHRMMLSNELPLKVDEHNKVFLTLRPCKGKNFKAIPHISTLAKGTMLALCFYEADAHDPSARLSRRNNDTEIAYLDFEGGTQLPLVVHANGFHKRLKKVLPLQLSQLFSMATLLDTRIMLLNSTHAKRVCQQDTLRNILQRAKARAAGALKKMELKKKG